MGAWELVVDALRPLVVGLLLIALGWAASERGRIHHHLAQVRRVSGLESAGRANRFGALDRSLSAQTSPHEPEGT